MKRRLRASAPSHRRDLAPAADSCAVLDAAASAATPRSARRVLVLALAAMSLNFLLGFTGVLSFGHAAYFGLGAYGAGLTIKYLVAEHAARHCCRHARSAASPAAIIGALIVRLRGVYFAMVTIAFGQVFYFIAFRWNSVTGGDDGLSRLARASRSTSASLSIDILQNDKAFYYFVLFCFAVAVGADGGAAALAVRPHAARDPRERAARAVSRHSGRAAYLAVVRRSPASSSALAGALYALLNNFADPRALRCDQSGDFVIMAVLGGMRSLLGAADRRRDFRRAAGLRLEP